MRDFVDRLGDTALAAALGTLYLAEILAGSEFAGDRLIAVPAALAFSASLTWRRRLPLVPMVLGLGVIELSNLEVRALAETGTFLVGFLLAIYSAGAHTEGRMTIAALALVAAAVPFAAIETGEVFTLADVGFFVVFFGGPFAGGRIMRRRRVRERVLEGRTTELEREGEERARAAVADERARIARELHDVVSHAVSVMVLQARGARRQLSETEAPVREALDTIERSGRGALEEMRRLLGLLRAEDEELALTPQPSLSRIDDLVRNVRMAGLPVEFSVQGEIRDLPAGIDVSAYRIVQEALTNALKHAGPARAHVLIRRSDEDLEIQVIDDGTGSGAGGGSRHGLIGMRERVAVFGGRFEAGQRPEGGYALSARLPLDSAR